MDEAHAADLVVVGDLEDGLEPGRVAGLGVDDGDHAVREANAEITIVRSTSCDSTPNTPASLRDVAPVFAGSGLVLPGVDVFVAIST
ncbi:hypothetical protein, partial [Nocardia seriolae]